MAENTQIPQLFTITSGQTLTITYARAISVLSQGGNSTVTNSNSQTMTLADGVTLEMQADNGNTLGIVTVTSASTALVTTISAICQLT
jgi:hypothetical protein